MDGAGSQTRAILGTLLKCIVIVTLIAGYPDIMRGGQSAFFELRNKFTSARDAKFVQLLRSTVQNQPSDSITEIGKIVPAAIGYFFQGIGRFMLLVLRFFQEFAIAGLIAVSPLLIGFLFFSCTQSVGVHFGVTSLTVCSGMLRSAWWTSQFSLSAMCFSCRSPRAGSFKWRRT